MITPTAKPGDPVHLLSVTVMLQPGDRVVIDPSLSEVSDASKLAGRGDLYGELGVLGEPRIDTVDNLVDDALLGT